MVVGPDWKGKTPPGINKVFPICGNDAVEATYPCTRMDATGEPLDGSKHNYTLTFSAGKLPPVIAFWSVTCMTVRANS